MITLIGKVKTQLIMITLIGLAGDIAKAAGPVLTKESKRYIKNYGRLSTEDVCITTAGRMPAKKVLNASITKHVS